MAGHYVLPLFSFFLFFLAYSQRSQTGCLPYFHTWCGLSANLECRSEMCCTRLDENAGHKGTQKFVICAPSHNFVGLSLQKGMYRKNPIEKTTVKQHMSSQYGPLTGEIGSGIWGTTANFNGFRLLAFCTDVAQRRSTTLCTMFGRTL